MKIINKILFLIIFLSLGSCGYEPIYSKWEKISTDIQSFEIKGDKRINRKIVSTLNLEDQIKPTGYKLIINSTKSLNTISKDATGKASSFKTKITVVISLLENDKLYKKKEFTSDFTYNNIKNKFDLSQYRQDIEANLINKIIEEISIFLISN